MHVNMCIEHCEIENENENVNKIEKRRYLWCFLVISIYFISSLLMTPPKIIDEIPTQCAYATMDDHLSTLPQKLMNLLKSISHIKIWLHSNERTFALNLTVLGMMQSALQCVFAATGRPKSKNKTSESVAYELNRL